MTEAPARYCGNCGNELGLGDQFCHNCGTPILQAATVPTPEADVPVPLPPQAARREQRQVVVLAQPKSMGVAYALWLFLGQLGLHRFYLDRAGSGIAQALLGVIGWATVLFIVGLIPLIILWIWLLVDLFLTASMVREANERVSAVVR